MDKDKIIKVKVFDFNTPDQNYQRTFDRNDFEEFLRDNVTKQQLKEGRFTSLASHKSRISDGVDICNFIALEDLQLINQDIVGIIHKLYIKSNDVFAEIKMLNTPISNYIIELINKGVKIGVSISFLDMSEDDRFYKIYQLNGVDFTLSPAMHNANDTTILGGY
jgi:hypothetical protein